MVFRAFLTFCMGAAVFMGGVALAQQGGATSGPAAGKNVEPSTAIEKKYEGQATVRQGRASRRRQPGCRG